MESNDFWKPRLKRITYDQLFDEAYRDFLFLHEKYMGPSAGGGDFHIADIPNRNPVQIPDGTWQKLLSRHEHKYFYN